MAKRPLRKAASDLQQQLNSDFNALVALTLEELATDENDGGASPVDTGFFASSWKASTQRTRPTDKREDYSPWDNIYKARSNAGNQWVHTQKKPAVDAIIRPRFPDPPEFKINQKVFIGNAAEYSVFALEGKGIVQFIQGRMGALIRSTFKEKQPRIAIANTATTGALGFLGGRTFVSYENL
jgi:hypothetical protein